MPGFPARRLEALRCQIVLYLNIIRDLSPFPPSFLDERNDIIFTYRDIWDDVYIEDYDADVAAVLQETHTIIMNFSRRLSLFLGMDLVDL